ncbi:hypothetical protein J6590_031268 [Homalodisca vitripennis]|nr:hypothetical protein J6590_031268 [Homalodisca vitripennis]
MFIFSHGNRQVNKDFSDPHNPDWSPSENQKRKQKSFNLQLLKRRKIVKDSDCKIADDSDDSDFPEELAVKQAGLSEFAVGDKTTGTSEPDNKEANVNSSCALSKKRKKSVRVREVEK